MKVLTITTQVNKTFKRILLLAIVIAFSTSAFAQFKVGDNQGIIQPSAALEVESTTKGFLMPRMTTIQMTAIANPTVGLMIFNTTTNCIHVYKSAVLGWKSTCDANDLGAWGLNGNTGNPATSFLGTTDANPLIVKTNGLEAFRVDPTGKVGFGISAPLYLIDVNTTADPIRLAGVLGGAITDSVLTINAAGVVKKRSVASILASAMSASNGLNIVANNVKLGGTLSQTTSIAQAGFNLAFTGTGNVGIGTATPTNRLHIFDTSNPLRIEGLVSGASPDSILTIDGTGVVRKRTVASIFSTGNAWLNGGNTITGPGTLGTINAQPFSIITNNSPILTFGSTGTITQGGTGLITLNGNIVSTGGSTQIGSTFINTSGATPTNIGNASSTTTVTGPTNINTTGTGTTTIGNTASTTNIAGNNLNITNLPSGSGTDSVMVVDPLTGKIKKVSMAFIGSKSFSADNGLTKTGSNVQLGGNLIKNTDIGLSTFNTTFSGVGKVGVGTTTPTNKLHIVDATNPVRFEGLVGGASTDSLVTTDANGVLRKRTVSSVLATGFTVDNGLTKTGTNAQLGGTLVQNTTINQATKDLSIVGGNVGIGAAAPNSTLQVTGSVSMSIRKVTTASTTITGSDYTVLANCTGGAITYTLPAASTCGGRMYIFVKTDATNNLLSFTPSLKTGEAVTAVLPAINYNTRIVVQSDGTDWWVVNQY